ncbi:MAG TPA: carboxypeptidase regulatory-like domain-containing protein [Blastocatellia bacterium]|nr:carboxypeptidase regulatory-like domain-containing protein [Blastocatellia bacterium]
MLSCLAVMLVAASEVPGQSPARSFEVSGVVLDPSGAVIADAKVTLRRDGGRSGETKTANQRGEFRFTRIASGDYEIEVRKDGFKPAVTRLTVGAKSPSPFEIVLPIVDVREEIAVADRPDQTNTDPDENLNVIKLNHETLSNLPVLGNDVIGSVANLLDAGSIGSDGPTIIVDGLETSRTKVPASTIQEVRINQNPYSAEFARLGRARIEVFTKPGSSQYHGEFNFLFRDHRLDARNAFALERPPEQRRFYEGNVSGPLGNGKTTSFLLSVNREEADLQSVVFASTPAGLVSENVSNPNRDTEISFRINHQVDKKTTFSIRYESQFDSTGNGGVGGFNLPEVATNSNGHEVHLFVTLRRILSPSLVSEFTMRTGNEGSLTRSVRPGIPRIVVLDAFTGGSSQADRRTTENHVQLNEILSWNHGKHFVRGGLNIPDISRRGFSDRTNFGGTFSFSTLTDYLNNRPFLFSITQGDGHLAFLQKDFGLFVQDNILVRANLSIGVGLRYDRQSFLGDNNNFAPRFSFAYSPDKKRKTVIRGGGGVFYDRTGIGPIADRLRFDGQRLREVSISNSGYPDPLSSGGTLATQPSNIVRFAPDIREPYIIQSGVGIERQLNKSLTATANYINTRGIKLYRSRDINAPLTPFLQRPDPGIGILRQVESTAHSQAHALELMLRGKISRFFNGTIQYTLGRAYNNTGGINSRPANNYDLTGEWSRADFDERHRFNLLGTIKAGEWFNLGMTLALTSGRPYSLTTGRDDNHDNLANDRPPGVPRNSLQGPGAATLDVRWAKEFRLKETKKKDDEGPSITIGVAAFNVLNRTNFVGFVGNLSSPFFGLPVASRPARRTQLTLGFKF